MTPSPPRGTSPSGAFDPLEAYAAEHHVSITHLREALASRGVDPEAFAVALGDGRADVDDLDRILAWP